MAKSPAGGTPAPRSKPPATETPAAGKATSKRRNTDWEAVERDYRTGKFTQRELADKYGVSHAAIGKMARSRKWQKDLSAEIRQATNAKLVSELVAKEVADGSREVANAVLAAAEVNKQVILSHRSRLGRIAAVAGTLITQIEQAAQHMPDLAEVIEMVRQPDDNGIDKANDALRRAMDRPQLVDDLKKLAEINERVIKGERQAFRLDEADADTDKPKGTDKTLTDAERAVRLYNLLTKAKA